MAHKFTVAFQGDSAAVLKTAQKMMADRGFEVSKIGGGEVRGTRNHSLTSGKKTNDMIVLVSELIIRASSGHLSAEADLGTLRKLIVFMIAIVVIVESVTLVIGLVVMEDMMMVKMMMVRISLLTVVPWFVIGPAMLLLFRCLALREIEKFLKNVAVIGSEE